MQQNVTPPVAAGVTPQRDSCGRGADAGGDVAGAEEEDGGCVGGADAGGG